MKKILHVIFILLSSLMFAQNADIASKINLSIVLPEEDEILNYNALAKLNSKTVQLLTFNEIVSGVNNSFVIYPSLMISDSKIIETGLYNVNSVELDFSFYIKNVESNTTFSSYSTKLKGVGKTEFEAVSNAISKLDIKDVNLTSFINKGKDKIIFYYKNSCTQIISKAESLAMTGSYEEALSLLIAIPSEVDCYFKAKQKAIAIYKQYSTKQCQSLLLEAKSYIVQKDKVAAASILATINPESSCKTEATNMLKQLEDKLNQQEKQEWDFILKQHNDNIELEKTSIKAIRDICTSYYKKNPITYNYIIR